MLTRSFKTDKSGKKSNTPKKQEKMKRQRNVCDDFEREKSQNL